MNKKMIAELQKETGTSEEELPDAEPIMRLELPHMESQYEERELERVILDTMRENPSEEDINNVLRTLETIGESQDLVTLDSDEVEEILRKLEVDAHVWELFHEEENRFRSFKNWLNQFVFPAELAETGFYYTGEADRIECFLCGVELYGWQE